MGGPSMNPVQAPAPPGALAQALIEALTDPVLVFDLEGRVIEANPAACRCLGYSREELLALTATYPPLTPPFEGGARGGSPSQGVEGGIKSATGLPNRWQSLLD